MPQLALNPEMFEQYRAFGKYARKQISEEMRTGNYPHIRGANTKGSNDVLPKFYKSRVNLIARPQGIGQTGARNLFAGNLETIVIIQSDFVDQHDFLSCFKLPGDGGTIRFVIGNLLEYHGTVSEYVRGYLKEHREKMITDLNNGNYKGFTKTILTIINSSVADFKIKQQL